MIQIRPMAEADIGAVEAIAATSPEAAQWETVAYRTMLTDPSKGQLLVAEQEGTVAGFVCIRVVGEEAEVLNLAVLPAARCQGVGAQLLHAGLERASESGAHRVFLEVRDSNAAALRLYERFGFRRVGSRPGYYQNPPADAVMLARPLRQPTEA